MKLQLKVGDRIKVPTWGHQKATVISIKPLIVQFDGRDYSTLRHYVLRFPQDVIAQRLSAKNAEGVEVLSQ